MVQLCAVPSEITIKFLASSLCRVVQCPGPILGIWLLPRNALALDKSLCRLFTKPHYFQHHPKLGVIKYEHGRVRNKEDHYGLKGRDVDSLNVILRGLEGSKIERASITSCLQFLAEDATQPTTSQRVAPANQHVSVGPARILILRMSRRDLPTKVCEPLLDLRAPARTPVIAQAPVLL